MRKVLNISTETHKDTISTAALMYVENSEHTPQRNLFADYRYFYNMKTKSQSIS